MLSPGISQAQILFLSPASLSPVPVMYLQFLSCLHIPSGLFPVHLFKVQPVWVLPWMHKDIWLSFCSLDWNARGNPVE